VAAARALLATLREEQAAADAERREAAGALQQLLASRLAGVESLAAALERAEAAGVEDEALLGEALGKLEVLEEEEAARLEAEELVRVQQEEEARRG